MILNLGCGAQVNQHCVNIDRNIQLRIARSPVLSFVATRILSDVRVRHIRELSKANIVLWDLANGIPYPDNSVDGVYHSHVLEHLDRNLENPSKDVALQFLRECRRVLKPGGVLRVVVPDLERRCQEYLQALKRHAAGEANENDIVQCVYAIIGQAVRKEAYGTSQQSSLQRWLENVVLGDARRRGETHQWEYDIPSLSGLIREAGFDRGLPMTYRESHIPDWTMINLDVHNGEEYKPSSIYVEAIK